MEKNLSPKNVLQLIEETRQLSFRVSEHEAYLKAQQERVTALQASFNEITALKTTFDEKSKQLDDKLKQLREIV